MQPYHSSQSTNESAEDPIEVLDRRVQDAMVTLTNQITSLAWLHSQAPSEMQPVQVRSILRKGMSGGKQDETVRTVPYVRWILRDREATGATIKRNAKGFPASVLTSLPTRSGS